MMYVTVPIIFPTLITLDIDPIHFGAILMTTVMLAVITPPIGMNLYVMSGIAKEPIRNVIKGVMPFIPVTIVLLVVIILWPDLSLFLPKLIYR